MQRATYALWMMTWTTFGCSAAIGDDTSSFGEGGTRASAGGAHPSHDDASSDSRASSMGGGSSGGSGGGAGASGGSGTGGSAAAGGTPSTNDGGNVGPSPHDAADGEAPVEENESTTPAVAPFSVGTWKERLIGADGRLDCAQHKNVAEHYDDPDVLEYRLGPTWADFHGGETRQDPTVWGRAAADGFVGERSQAGNWWFSYAGPLAYQPDDASDPGVALATSFSRYGSSSFDANGGPLLTIGKLTWTPNYGDSYLGNPDPFTVTQASWKEANGGAMPRTPVAMARARAIIPEQGIVVFANGMVGIDTIIGWDGGARDFVKLPPHKKPTAAAVTLNSEFALVTVWDTDACKGQLAVIALEGTRPADSTGPHFHYGLPSFPILQHPKILGYVDLPFAAPSAVSATGDFSQWNSGRGFTDNTDVDLSQASERAKWNDDRSKVGSFKHTQHSGYALVASRAESKVAFVDLEPLFAFYRKMYFTTQENFDATRTTGLADDAWPYRFSRAPEQTPVVASTLEVPHPTAIATGYWQTYASQWSGDDTFGDKAYVASMEGKLTVFRVGGLNTEGPASSPSVWKELTVGQNTTLIDVNRQTRIADRLFLTSRGDREITKMESDGTVHSVLRDSRMVDPVGTSGSFGYQVQGLLTVLDFHGKQVHTYEHDRRCQGSNCLLGGGLGQDGNAPFEYDSTTDVPGRPYLYQTAEEP